MRASGVELMVDSTDLGVVGLVEVLKQLPLFLKTLNDLTERAKSERPDCVVLIDYPGFNLRFAERLHNAGIKVVYYVSPQVWAWGKRRIPKIAQWVDKMLVIFPFEPEVFKKTDINVEFVGHPLIEIIEEEFTQKPVRDPKTALLLPGSRLTEVKKLLPSLIATAAELSAEYPDLHFVIPATSDKIFNYIQNYITKKQTSSASDSLQCVREPAREWLFKADFGLAASGTVTVEAAIAGLPLTVVYKLNPFTYWLGSRLVDINYFTMVNIVAGKEVFEEFLQKEVTPARLKPAAEKIMSGGSRRLEVETGMSDAVAKLGGNSKVCRKAAEKVFETIRAGE